MDEDKNGSINGTVTATINQQPICSSTDFNSSTAVSTTSNNSTDIEWAFSQVKGTLEDEVADSKSSISQVLSTNLCSSFS